MAKNMLPVKDTNILIRVDAKFKARLVRAATKKRQKLSEFIRTALDEKLSSGT